MKKLTFAAASAALVLGSVTLAMAQDRDDRATPGHEMQERGGVPGHPGASGFAPGHRDMDDRGTLRDRDDRGMMRDRDRDRDER